MEAAIAVATLAAVLLLCVGGLAAVVTHVRCVDAAREAARLAARGEDASKVPRPSGATVRVDRRADEVLVRVSATSVLLPGLVVAAEAVAAVEPGVR